MPEPRRSCRRHPLVLPHRQAIILARLLELLESSRSLALLRKGIHMPSNEPTPAQIDLIRNLVRSVTLENVQPEYEKARLQFTSKEEFQVALRFVEHEIQQHLTWIEHLRHLATM